jgi:hypothetical protein
MAKVTREAGARNFITVHITADLELPLGRMIEQVRVDLQKAVQSVPEVGEGKSVRVTSNWHPDPFNMPETLRADLR